MQINIATGNATINVNNETEYEKLTKEKILRRIKLLEKYLQNNDVDDNTKTDFEEQISDLKEQLGNFN